MELTSLKELKRLNFTKVYSSVFSLFVFGILIFFLPFPDLAISKLSETFRWRNNLIEAYELFRFYIGDRIYNGAVIGKEGWIFYTGETSIQDYQNTDPAKKRALVQWQKKLDRINADLKKNGGMLLVVIPPNKSTVYSQYMPDEIPVLGSTSRLDQFLEYMRLHSQTTVVDLRKLLMDARRTKTVYYKTDSHWNDLGAFIAYAEIMNRLAVDYPELLPLSESDFEYVYAGESVHDLPVIMGLQSLKEQDWILTPKVQVQLKATEQVLPDEFHSIRTVTNINEELPTLLVFGDSFYVSLAPFLEPHFGKVKTIPYISNKNIWSLKWIQDEKPDIVIIEVVERYLIDSLSTLLED